MCILEKDGYIEISILVQPRSSKNMVSGIFDDKIKIKLTSPPVDGAANECLIKFLSKKLSISKSNITILSGEKSRQKVLKFRNISKEQIRNALGIAWRTGL